MTPKISDSLSVISLRDRSYVRVWQYRSTPQSTPPLRKDAGSNHWYSDANLGLAPSEKRDYLKFPHIFSSIRTEDGQKTIFSFPAILVICLQRKITIAAMTHEKFRHMCRKNERFAAFIESKHLVNPTYRTPNISEFDLFNTILELFGHD